MHSHAIRAIRAEISAFSPSYLPVGIFVGGTSGIGQGLAESFARATKGNAQIFIIGRNKTAADEIFAKFPQPTDANARHEFVKCDATLMKNVGSVTNDLLTRLPKINFLVLTPGFFSLKGRDETDEGIDRKMAVHYYARFKFIHDLLPALERAKADGEDAKVLSVLAAGTGAKIDLNDLGLKKTFTVSRAASQAPAYNDAMMLEFAKRHPNVTFAHAHPGNVKTNATYNTETRWVRALAPVISGLHTVFAVDQETSGEYLLAGLLRSSEGASFLGAKGEDLGKMKYSEDVCQKVWDHSIKETELT